MSIKIDISIGELLDKITILEIKFKRIDDPNKRANVETELAVLTNSWINSGLDIAKVDSARAELKAINETLWEIEDDIRLLEKRKDFGSGFVELARKVYLTNDQRARVKREVNEALGSVLIEEKSYQSY